MSPMNAAETRTPLQIVVVRERMDRRTDVYVDTLRLAFEGSADSAGQPSAYLAEAVDLGIRVSGAAGSPCGGRRKEPCGRCATHDLRRDRRLA